MSKDLATNAPRIHPGPEESPIYGTREETHIELGAAALTDELKKRGLLSGYVVLWQMQNVLWGTVEDGKISLADGSEKGTEALETMPSEYWQELRVFNDEAELHLTRRGAALVGRFRSDAGGQDAIEYIDAMSRLWGERDKNQSDVPEHYVRLKDEARGLSLTVPADGTASWYGLVTRNYIEPDEETHQAGYADYRFLRIVDADMKGV